ncbi:MAG: ribosome maturation factor RimP [Desulfovibrio sp.]|nr:ribosome maturation factor RimP [Desulfovibrio sp.]
MPERDPSTVLETIRALALPVVQAAGLDLWGIELQQSRRTVVRLFIDGSTGGGLEEEQALHATLDQCAEISRLLGLALEVEDLFPDAWVLEVSTPGLSRTFFTLEQMKAYVGDVVDIRLAKASPDASSRKSWRGVLKEVTEDAFILKPCLISESDVIEPLAEDEVRFLWKDVRKARRVALFPKAVKPGKGPARKKNET